jgi:hypothetical protein
MKSIALKSIKTIFWFVCIFGVSHVWSADIIGEVKKTTSSSLTNTAFRPNSQRMPPVAQKSWGWNIVTGIAGYIIPSGNKQVLRLEKPTLLSDDYHIVDGSPSPKKEQNKTSSLGEGLTLISKDKNMAAESNCGSSNPSINASGEEGSESGDEDARSQTTEQSKQQNEKHQTNNEDEEESESEDKSDVVSTTSSDQEGSESEDNSSVDQVGSEGGDNKRNAMLDNKNEEDKVESTALNNVLGSVISSDVTLSPKGLSIAESTQEINASDSSKNTNDVVEHDTSMVFKKYQTDSGVIQAQPLETIFPLHTTLSCEAVNRPDARFISEVLEGKGLPFFIGAAFIAIPLFMSLTRK